MKQFTVYDTKPLSTQQLEAAKRGQVEFICGRSQPRRLGEVEATNAANALLQARAEWPHVPTRQLFARETPPGGAE